MVTRRLMIGWAGLAPLALAQGAWAQATPEASPVPIDDEMAAAILDALTPEPTVPDEDDEFSPRGLDGFDRYVGKSYTAVDAGFEMFFTGGLTGLIVLGIAFETEEYATAAVTELLEVYRGFIETWDPLGSASPVISVDTADVSIGRLGEQRAAMVTSFVMDGEGIDEYVAASATIRKERWVQMLVGLGVSGVVAATTEVAEDLIDRWPSGVLNDMLPELDDLPPGMAED